MLTKATAAHPVCMATRDFTRGHGYMSPGPHPFQNNSRPNIKQSRHSLPQSRFKKKHAASGQPAVCCQQRVSELALAQSHFVLLTTLLRRTCCSDAPAVADKGSSGSSGRRAARCGCCTALPWLAVLCTLLTVGALVVWCAQPAGELHSALQHGCCRSALPAAGQRQPGCSALTTLPLPLLLRHVHTAQVVQAVADLLKQLGAPQQHSDALNSSTRLLQTLVVAVVSALVGLTLVLAAVRQQQVVRKARSLTPAGALKQPQLCGCVQAAATLGAGSSDQQPPPTADAFPVAAVAVRVAMPWQTGGMAGRLGCSWLHMPCCWRRCGRLQQL